MSKFAKKSWITRIKHNCVVEGELGMLVGAQHDDGEEGGGYSKGGAYTHPDEAVQFVQADRRGFAGGGHRQFSWRV